MSKERRSYFRIDDQASITCIAVDEAMPPNELETFFAKLKNQPLFIELQNLNDTTNLAIDQLGKTSPVMASCLRALNMKMDLMVKLMKPDFTEPHSEDYTNINLSEGGLRVSTTTQFKAGQIVAIKLTLLPEYLRILVCGKVTHAKKEGDKYETGIEFLEYPASMRQKIVKHIIRFQTLQQRQEG